MTSPASAPDRAQVRGENIVYLASSLLAALLIDRFVFSLPFERRRLGWSLVLAATIGSLLSYLQFRRIDESASTSQPNNTLVESGPYRFSRNPMYLMDLVLQAGISMLLGTWWGIVLLVPTWLMYHHWAVLPEEAYLERRFSDAYLDYKRRVRRWV